MELDHQRRCPQALEHFAGEELDLRAVAVGEHEGAVELERREARWCARSADANALRHAVQRGDPVAERPRSPIDVERMDDGIREQAGDSDRVEAVAATDVDDRAGLPRDRGEQRLCELALVGADELRHEIIDGLDLVRRIPQARERTASNGRAVPLREARTDVADAERAPEAAGAAPGARREN